jgi:epoxide hydrolase
MIALEAREFAAAGVRAGRRPSRNSYFKESSLAPQDFRITVPQESLDDLRQRIRRTRWLDVQRSAGWRYGIDSVYLHELADYWLNGYRWRTHEAALNKFAQFRAEISGTKIHFIHERGRGANPTPLLLLHGFPDSFYRYHKVIERLTDPAKFGGDPRQSFDVVVPSIPGTGFSDPVALDIGREAELFAKLMSEVLGYRKFIAGGGDHGSMITLALARARPELLIGMHLTDVGWPDGSTDFASLSAAEMQMAQWVQRWFTEEGIGVNMIMATKPQTLAFGLNDSPVGLAAWLIGYSSSGEKGKEEFGTRFTPDEVLTNVTIYWVTQTIYSAARGYFENAHTLRGGSPQPTPVVPAAVTHCPYDPPLPREWAARHVNLVQFTDFPRGGHFMAWEEPELFARDVQAFAATLRSVG